MWVSKRRRPCHSNMMSLIRGPSKGAVAGREIRDKTEVEICLEREKERREYDHRQAIKECLISQEPSGVIHRNNDDGRK